MFCLFLHGVSRNGEKPVNVGMCVRVCVYAYIHLMAPSQHILPFLAWRVAERGEVCKYMCVYVCVHIHIHVCTQYLHCAPGYDPGPPVADLSQFLPPITAKASSKVARGHCVRYKAHRYVASNHRLSCNKKDLYSSRGLPSLYHAPPLLIQNTGRRHPIGSTHCACHSSRSSTRIFRLGHTVRVSASSAPRRPTRSLAGRGFGMSTPNRPPGGLVCVCECVCA